MFWDKLQQVIFKGKTNATGQWSSYGEISGGDQLSLHKDFYKEGLLFSLLSKVAYFSFSFFLNFLNCLISPFSGCSFSQLTARSSPTGKHWLSLSVQMTNLSLWLEVNFDRITLLLEVCLKNSWNIDWRGFFQSICRGQWHCKLCISSCLWSSHRQIQVTFLDPSLSVTLSLFLPQVTWSIHPSGFAT